MCVCYADFIIKFGQKFCYNANQKLSRGKMQGFIESRILIKNKTLHAKTGRFMGFMQSAQKTKNRIIKGRVYFSQTQLLQPDLYL